MPRQPARPLKRTRPVILAGTEPIFDRTPPEFDFVVACCLWPPSPGRDQLVAARAAGLHWPMVERIARRHRVEGLVWAAIRRTGLEVPAELGSALASAAEAIVRQNLRIAAESQRLKEAFAAAELPLLFVKGLSLAMLAYGNIMLKSGWDIDILVPPDAAAGAAMLLRQSGYVPTVPKGASDEHAIAAWHSGWKESVWWNARRGTHIELHTGLVDHPMLLPQIGISSPRQEVPITGGISLLTLATDELFAYLCVHGASSAWFRLKWVADLAALLDGREAAEIDRLYRRSQALGAGRAADVGLLLCHRLFGTGVSDRLVQELLADRVGRLLIKAVERSLSGRGVATEITEMRLGTFWIHLFQLGTLPGLRYKLVALRRELGALRRLATKAPKRT